MWTLCPAHKPICTCVHTYMHIHTLMWTSLCSTLSRSHVCTLHSQTSPVLKLDLRELEMVLVFDLQTNTCLLHYDPIQEAVQKGLESCSHF